MSLIIISHSSWDSDLVIVIISRELLAKVNFLILFWAVFSKTSSRCTGRTIHPRSYAIKKKKTENFKKNV